MGRLAKRGARADAAHAGHGSAPRREEAVRPAGQHWRRRRLPGRARRAVRRDERRSHSRRVQRRRERRGGVRRRAAVSRDARLRETRSHALGRGGATLARGALAMFRTARAFLLVAPGGFVLVLVAFLAAHPQAIESFVAYPILADALGSALSKRPLVRFIAASIVLFIPPYLMSGLLLLFADLGVSAAAPLWSRGQARRTATSVPPETRWAFFVSAAFAAMAAGLVVAGLVAVPRALIARLRKPS